MSTIKLVAVDEDGTFLRDHKTYDTERFSAAFDRMEAVGCRFVVATGNQYYQVRSLFPDHADRIGYVTANGSLIEAEGERIFAAQAPQRAIKRMIEIAHADPTVPYMMAGVKGAYVERTAAQWFFDDMSLYCTNLWWVDDFSQVDDQIFMFSSVVEEDRVKEVVASVRQLLDGEMDVVESGEGYFDVVCPGVTKATGLQLLLDRWGISPEDCVAFGDSDNDLAMLSLVGTSYAMGNAPQHVKDQATHLAPPCTEDGVLQVLDQLFPVKAGR